MLKNMTAGKEGIGKLKDEGIIEVMENGDAKFVTKQIQTEALENHLNRLEKNIYTFSQVPNLSDENFAGNLSGVAIRFKLFGLETKCIIKERKMEKAIRELVRVLSVPIRVSTGKDIDLLNLKVEFTRNVPNNLTEIVDTVSKLDGKVDKETLLSLLPFIDNPKEVLEKLKQDAQRTKEINDPYSLANVEADGAILFPNLNSPQEQLNAVGATIPQPTV
jgi:SPP1 family phage portal protein